MTRREERIEAMSKLPNEEVLHRICDYPDPDLLNKNARFPVEQIAIEQYGWPPAGQNRQGNANG